MRHRLEYAPVWLLVRLMGLLPRSMARALGMAAGQAVYLLHGKLRRVGLRNLEIAFPQKRLEERRAIVRSVFRNLGRQFADFCELPKLTRDNVAHLAVYDGLENLEKAQARGRGVLVLTGHFGGWEIGSYAHSVYGHPMTLIVRDLDNPYIDEFIRGMRTRDGNTTVDNRDFARGILRAARAGEAVGILMDTNMTPPQGVFVDFFGHEASTASGLARVALKTGAAVVPGFTFWDEAQGKYVITFWPEIDLVRTNDAEADVVANTAAFTKVIEAAVRQRPEQWLWVHRRWKTRPPGSEPMY
jgi:KDO2-lipid IV(A) lauroyltransferase